MKYSYSYRPFVNFSNALLLWGLFFFPSCIDEVSFPPSEENIGNLAIQGKLLKGNPSIISLSINQIGALTDTSSSKPVNVSEVLLLNDLGQKINLHSYREGGYQAEIPASSPFSVHTGIAYQIQITTLNGDQIISSFEPMFPVPQMDNISFDILEKVVLDRNELEVIHSFLSYKISTPLPSSQEMKPLLRWTFEGCTQFVELRPPEVPPPPPYLPPDTCYITEKLNIEKVTIFDGRSTSSDYLPDYAVLEETLNSRYVYGYYITVFQESLSPGAYAYWHQISQITERDGGLFEVPAGEIESNFTNVSRPDEIIYGYFYASEQDTLRRYISPASVNYPEHLCDPFSGDGYYDAPERCRNCLEWNNSSLQRPDYWVE